MEALRLWVNICNGLIDVRIKNKEFEVFAFFFINLLDYTNMYFFTKNKILKTNLKY